MKHSQIEDTKNITAYEYLRSYIRNKGVYICKGIELTLPKDVIVVKSLELNFTQYNCYIM